MALHSNTQMGYRLKQTIHEATFVTGNNKATWSFAHAYGKMRVAFNKSRGNRPPAVYSKVTCRMYHAIFHVQAHTYDHVALSPVTKFASCTVCLRNKSDSTCRRNVQYLLQTGHEWYMHIQNYMYM